LILGRLAECKPSHCGSKTTCEPTELSSGKHYSFLAERIGDFIVVGCLIAAMVIFVSAKLATGPECLE
jgi:hypothetical protein